MKLTSEYGSLAFMYAKHVHKGLRPKELVPERMLEAVESVMTHIEENHLESLYD